MGRTFTLVGLIGLAGLAAVAIALTDSGDGAEASDVARGVDLIAPPTSKRGGESIPIEISQRGRTGFIEGGFTFLQVKRPKGGNGPSTYGRFVDAQFLGSRFDAGYALPRGSRFRVVSYQRACGGFCSPRSLDPRNHGCSATVSTKGVEAISVRIDTRGRRAHCRMAVGYAQASE